MSVDDVDRLPAERMACSSIQSALALRVPFGAGGATNAFTGHSSFLRDFSCMTTTRLWTLT